MQGVGISGALRRLALMALAAALLVLAALPGTASAAKSVGAVYTETNGADKNELLVYKRLSNGVLTLRQRVATGGTGGKQPQPGCDPPADHKCPLLDAQNEVVLTNNGKLVFAVNAGSNTISSFRVGRKGKVRRVQTVGSKGVFPNSIAIHNKLLYVLNANSSNIAGFRFSERGRLKRIRGSRQDMNPQHAPLARQIGFDRTGRLLVVSSLTDARFDVFRVNRRGVAGPPTAQPSASPEPFAFAFDPRNNLISVEVVNDMDFSQSSNASSYRVSKTGRLTNINTVPTQGYAGCWTVITKDGKYAFIVNTGGPSPFGAVVSSFRIATNGTLTFLSKTTPEAGSFTLTDEALSHDDKYLYVVTPLTTPGPLAPPGAAPPANSKIVTFKVGGNGGLTKVQETAATEEAGMSGLAAH